MRLPGFAVSVEGLEGKMEELEYSKFDEGEQEGVERVRGFQGRSRMKGSSVVVCSLMAYDEEAIKS